MSDETSSSQYSDASKQLVNLGPVADTNAPGSDTGGYNGQYVNGRIPGTDVTDVANTGAPGSDPSTPPRDGSTATVTDFYGQLGGNGHTVSGSTSTSKDSLSEPFTHENVTDTGAGHGSPTHSNAGGADQSSGWEKV